MDDVRAVIDAVGSERAALFGYSEGGPMCCLFAATYPGRTTALILYGTYAKRTDPDDNYPWAATWEQRQEYADQVEREWGFKSDLATMAPNADAALTAWWRERSRAAASPGAARALILMNSRIDVRYVLPTIQAPTLVLHRSGDRDSQSAKGSTSPTTSLALATSSSGRGPHPVDRRRPDRRRSRGVPHRSPARSRV